MLVGMIAILVILTTVLIVKLTHSGDGLKGTWHADEYTVYEYDGKGSGSMHTSLSEYPFTYEAKDGALSIDSENEASRDTVYQYSIKGKTLTLTREDGTYTLTKD